MLKSHSAVANVTSRFVLLHVFRQRSAVWLGFFSSLAGLSKAQD